MTPFPLRLTRATALCIVASFLISASAVALPSGSVSDETHNIEIVYDTNPANWTRVAVPSPAVAPSPTADACIQPVRITVKSTGDVVTLVGAATGSGACTTTSPCSPYDPASEVVSCVPTTIAGIGPLFVISSVSIDAVSIG